MGNLQVPGVAWAAFLIGLSALIQANWPDEPWAQFVLLALAGIVKGLHVNWDEWIPGGQAGAGSERTLSSSRSKWERFWLG